MGESWIVSNLNAALSTWNDKLAEIWSLLTESPQTFKGGQVWGVMTGIHGALQAIGYGLLVLFFAVGVMKTCGSFVEVKKPEHALKLFIRFALAKGAVTYGLELMLAVFSIVQGMLCKEGYADVLFELGNRMSPLQSVEYCDNRLARFVASKGKCEITGKLLSVNEVHCHHFLPRHLGGTDQYSNLRIVHVEVHRLIHATTPESIQFYLRKTGCYKKPCLDKINRWRASANLPAITL